MRFFFKSTWVLLVGFTFLSLLNSNSQAQENNLRKTPDALTTIELSISAVQIVGHEFVNSARITLRDENGDLVTDYDLAANPITLVPSQGLLNPAILDDPALVDSGNINFLPAGITYYGPTGNVEIYATNGTVDSDNELVSFSGYDILSAFDFKGNPISEIYAGLPTAFYVNVQNNGNRLAFEQPTLKSYFKSLGGGSAVNRFYDPGSNGDIDTLFIQLVTANLDPGEDTLVLALHSDYQIGDSLYGADDTLEIPVVVFNLATFALDAEAFSPDTVYSGVPFNLSFEIDATDFMSEVDSTDVAVYLTETVGGSRLATIYAGAPQLDSLSNNRIYYSNLQALIDTSAHLISGLYYVEFVAKIISAGNVFTVQVPQEPTIDLLSPATLSYVENSFDPTEISGGREVHFSFDIDLSDVADLEIQPESTLFRITDNEDFSTTINLQIPSNILMAGTNHITTQQLVVPLNQIGDTLMASAQLFYRQPGSANFFKFMTDFDSVLIAVRPQPEVRIVDLQIVAPNPPNVNTDQPFQLRALVANESDIDVKNLELALVSDGHSAFDPTATIDTLMPLDTAEAFFDIVADSQPNSAEIFQVSITTQGLIIQEPVRNAATVTIQIPAALLMSANLVGVENGLVEIGSPFSLEVILNNLGQADVTVGKYILSTGGVDLGIADPFTGNITDNVMLRFNLTAPSFDTSAMINFVISQRPLDINSQTPAQIADTTFEASVKFVSFEADLFVDKVPLQTNLLSAGQEADLFQLNLTNTGISDITRQQLKCICMNITDRSGALLNPRDIVETGYTGFYENGNRVTTTTIGPERIVMMFSDFFIEAGQTRKLVFHTKIKEITSSEFVFSLNKKDIQVVFTDPVMAGDSVNVATESGTDEIIDDNYIAVQTDLKSSFLIENNPYNPSDGPARFSFYLDDQREVEFRVFSLIGEEVYDLNIPASQTSTGQNFITQWHGQNNAGETVLNGAYIVVLSIPGTGKEARLKVAVVR